MASRPRIWMAAAAALVAGAASWWWTNPAAERSPTTTTAKTPPSPPGSSTPEPAHGAEDAPSASGAQAAPALRPADMPLPTPPSPASTATAMRPTTTLAPSKHDVGEVDAGDDAPAEAPRFAGSSDGIREAMAFAKDDLRECYDAWAKLQPDLTGKLKVSFVIAPQKDGTAKVDDIALADSSLQHTWVEGCVKGVVGELSFEPPEGGGELRVTYPIAFSTKHE